MGSSSRKISTRILAEPEFDAWRQFVLEAPSGSIYSLPEYLDILCSTAGGAFKILGAFRGDELVGGIALYEMHTPIGRYVSTRLLLYYNGIVLREYDSKYASQTTARQLAAMEAILDALAGLAYPRVEFRNRHSIEDLRICKHRGWNVTPSYSYMVDVSNLDDTWDRIEQNLRRLINRCEDSDLVFSEDDGFEDFYRLHLATHERKGAPLYLPKATFGEYYRRLKAADLAALYHIRTLEGQSVAAQMVLFGGHPVTHTVTAAADGEYASRGVNPFLRWKVFQAINERGFEANDLTDAALNEVTRFKSQLGGDLVTNFVVRKPESFGFRLREWSLNSARRALGPIYMMLKGRK